VNDSQRMMFTQAAWRFRMRAWATQHDLAKRQMKGFGGIPTEKGGSRRSPASLPIVRWHRSRPANRVCSNGAYRNECAPKPNLGKAVAGRLLDRSE
jgi:hypothetical protein